MAAVLASGCAAAAPSPNVVPITGSIYVDFHVDAPCDVQSAPRELSGVALTFRNPAGSVVGRAATSTIHAEPLEFGPGKVGWTHPGCRYVAPYGVDLARASSYTVEFAAPEPVEQPGGGYYSGVADLEPQTISYEDLAAAGFSWSFEAGASYVVP